MFFNVMRDTIGGRARAPFLLGIFFLSPGAFAAEVGFVEVAGSHLVVEVETAAHFDPTVQLELRLLSEDGLVIDSEHFMPIIGGVSQVTLYGEFRDLDTRGWQHRLELLDPTAAIDSLDLRFGLDCSGSPCEIVARQGLLIEGGLSVGPSLAPSVAPNLQAGLSVDLDQLAQSDPSLQDAVYEMSVELMTRTLSTRCRCFFLAGVTGGGLARSVISARWEPSNETLELHYRWGKLAEANGFLRAGHTTYKEVTMDFACFQTTYAGSSSVQTNGGVLDISTPILAPCPQSCAPSVSWKAKDVEWSTYIDSHIDVTVAAAFDIEWEVDGVQYFQYDDSWWAGGAQYLPWASGGSLAQAPSPVTASLLPSSSRTGGWSTVEVDHVTVYDRPQVEVAAGATLVATGKAACAQDARVVAEPRELADGMAPATLPVILGPGENP